MVCSLQQVEHVHAVLLFISQNDQSTGEIKVIGGDDLSTLTGKVGPRLTTESVSVNAPKVASSSDLCFCKT